MKIIFTVLAGLMYACLGFVVFIVLTFVLSNVPMFQNGSNVITGHSLNGLGFALTVLPGIAVAAVPWIVLLRKK